MGYILNTLIRNLLSLILLWIRGFVAKKSNYIEMAALIAPKTNFYNFEMSIKDERSFEKWTK